MLWVLLSVGLGDVSAHGQTTVDGSVESADLRLYRLIDERLELMRDVAAWKWLQDSPVEDLAREAVVIESAVADGLRRGIRPESSERFFRVQIDAAKEIQRYWFERWQQGDPPRTAPDLGEQIRPQLLALGSAIIDAGATDGLQHSSSRFDATVSVVGLSPSTRSTLYQTLADLRRFQSRLQQIQQTGVLRVGTTGDYAPFSHTIDGQEFEGIDIELAADLAGALAVRLELVPTSWPTLVADLQAGRYDLAMSGVSRTVARARDGYFSGAYYVGGKQPIARCSDRARFGTLADIDRPGVRVVVNPGGTNEAFVDLRIQAAEKVLHSDNRTIFDALVDGSADVMITDSIEVALQTRRHPELCGTMAQTLTYQEKGYLMPRDDALKTFVDLWLELRMGDGTVNDLIQKYLATP